jgi:DNA-binding NarL/FixJ family response regulator
MSCRVLVADDHPLMRAALRQALTQEMPDAEIVEASDFAQVGASVAGGGVDVVLLDLHMPGATGLLGLSMLRSEHPAIPVVVVSAIEDAGTIQRAMEFGASGFVPKSAPIAQIGEAVQAVLDGEIWTPDVPPAAEEDTQLAERIGSLTPQQLRVLAGIVEGKLNKQIAYEMNVAETTVKAHITVILRRLGVISRTQAALLASRLAPGAPVPPVE